MVTYAVIGHNEEETVADAVAEVRAAARDGDRVWFVDSASTDGSAAIAAALGAEVVRAPAGKGRAVAAALERCETPWFCTFDAHFHGSERNIAVELRDALEAGDADMVIAQFEVRGDRTGGVSKAITGPLLQALFPEAGGASELWRLSGFRAWRTALDLGPLPTTFGLETHLNMTALVSGASIEVHAVGWFAYRYRVKPILGIEVADAVLDVAQREGRLAPERRAEWDAWVAVVNDVAAAWRNDGSSPEDHARRLHAASARPLPPAR